MQNASHDWTLNLQKDLVKGSGEDRFWRGFEEYTSDDLYMIFVLASCVFVSRERFWYYLLAILSTNYVKEIIKLF